ncbi:TRAP dicarboxylate transporter subunit DctP [Nitratireductor indicus C115]|uniref:TRAP dicarboxylate transporter subunit DctP n=1 Tax=Nitratireductor indicus C115 TaxID=1231190 RepID=K2NMW7_9HYPH|nr:TRAP transporter substrate-binding protein [Nitratireductor indicus]EKF40780.1 TRAP dicarboxylate transporter subunit DctP [Nitratireductor indicus C115]SFQ75513.1 tripartite ATP-independent transporter solute receptor, DctP family [Nitratireductor indicus]
MKISKLLLAAVAAFGMGGSASAADFNLRIHTLVKSPHPYNDMAAFLKEDIEAKSDGRIAVRIFDSGQLGQDPAVISEIGLGTIDMMISTTSNAVQQVPEYAIFTMPYIFTSMDDALAKVGPGTPIEAHFQKVYEERGLNMKLLALGASGTRNMSTAETVVNGPDDLKGLKMRTPPSPMDSKTWAAFGMLPVTVAWGELYAAMQTGVAQAMESSLPGYTGSKLYEVAPNLALTAHTIQVNHTSISNRTWNKLPEDLQKIVQASAIEANKLGVEKAKQYDDELVSELETKHGVKVTRPDTAAFIEVLAPIQTELAKELDLEDEYALVKAK